ALMCGLPAESRLLLTAWQQFKRRARALLACPMARLLLIMGRFGRWRARGFPEVNVPLIKNRYGKGRVRVMRIHRDGDRHEVSQLNIKAMVEGDFARTYTHHDNANSVSTDTIKNVVNVVA